MMRTLAAFGIVLGLVGSAHAKDAQVAVSLAGKSHAAVRLEVYRAAQMVCASDAETLNPVDTACVEATYAKAMHQVRSQPKADWVAYQIPANTTR